MVIVWAIVSPNANRKAPEKNCNRQLCILLNKRRDPRQSRTESECVISLQARVTGPKSSAARFIKSVGVRFRAIALEVVVVSHAFQKQKQSITHIGSHGNDLPVWGQVAVVL